MRSLPGLLVLVALGPVPGPLAAEPGARTLQQASALCRKGGQALAKGDASRAAEAFDKALAVLPTFPDAHLGLGHLAMGEQRFDDALASYLRARDGYGALGDALQGIREQNYRETQEQIGRLRDQISNLGRGSMNTTTGTDPRREAEITRDLTALQDQLRRLEAIEPPTDRKSSEPPAEVWFYIGNAQFRLERYDEARASWETCAKLNPDFAQIHNNLAVVYWKAGRFEEAETELRTAERLGFPVSPKMKEDLARARAEAGR